MTHFVGSGIRTPPPEKLTLPQKAWVLLAGVRLPRPENRQTPSDFRLGYETVTFGSSDEVTIEAWLIRQSTSRGVVLIFHGYGGAKDSLLPATKEFHDLGYDALVVDFRGSGGSGGDTTSIGYHEADDVAAAVKFARALPGSKPIVLYGSSMGAAAILRAIQASGVQPDSIILECPFDNLLTTIQHRFDAMHLPAFPFAQLLTFWGGAQQGFNGFRHNPADYARQVHCPALLIHGGRDARVSVTEVRHIYDNLSGPKALELFPDFGHGSPVTQFPDRWRARVREFLDHPVIISSK